MTDNPLNEEQLDELQEVVADVARAIAARPADARSLSHVLIALDAAGNRMLHEEALSDLLEAYAIMKMDYTHEPPLPETDKVRTLVRSVVASYLAEDD